MEEKFCLSIHLYICTSYQWSASLCDNKTSLKEAEASPWWMDEWTDRISPPCFIGHHSFLDPLPCKHLALIPQLMAGEEYRWPLEASKPLPLSLWDILRFVVSIPWRFMTVGLLQGRNKNYSFGNIYLMSRYEGMGMPHITPLSDIDIQAPRVLSVFQNSSTAHSIEHA